MTFDEQVAAWRGKSAPKNISKKKSQCTPEEWAAKLDYHSSRPNRDGKKQWRKNNPEKARDLTRKCNQRWRKKNPQGNRESSRKWSDANPNYEKERRQTDPHYRMASNLRSRQNSLFKGKTRSLSMVRDMGCNREFFLRHIASQFTAGMTMENYGTVWHLDHIYPLAKADIVGNPVHFLAAANWRNLQPMLGPDNWEKSDEVTPEAQELFDALCKEFSQQEGGAA